MFDSEFSEKLGKSWPKFHSLIRTNRLYSKRGSIHEIPNELHAGSYTVFRMEPRIRESTTIIDRIILNFPSFSSERKTSIHLDFSPWGIQNIESFSLSFPFSPFLVSDEIPLKYSVHGRLIKNNTFGLDEFHSEEYGSKKRILFRKRNNLAFSNFIRSVYRDSSSRATFLRYHSNLSFDTILCYPFGYGLTGY